MWTEYSTSEKRSLVLIFAFSLSALFSFSVAEKPAVAESSSEEYTTDFRLEECTFINKGRNPYFVLEPGYKLELKGFEGKDFVELTITVLKETQFISFTSSKNVAMRVETRVVAEVEKAGGQERERSRNYFAICKENNNVVYFGEDVVPTTIGGSWRAGVGGAQPGLIMPGTFLLGARYFQEIAPPDAMDRALHTAMGLPVVTDAGTFSECVEVVETTPLDASARSLKVYCPGIGLVRDGTLTLTDWSERR